MALIAAVSPYQFLNNSQIFCDFFYMLSDGFRQLIFTVWRITLFSFIIRAAASPIFTSISKASSLSRILPHFSRHSDAASHFIIFFLGFFDIIDFHFSRFSRHFTLATHIFRNIITLIAIYIMTLIWDFFSPPCFIAGACHIIIIPRSIIMPPGDDAFLAFLWFRCFSLSRNASESFPDAPPPALICITGRLTPQMASGFAAHFALLPHFGNAASPYVRRRRIIYDIFNIDILLLIRRRL